SAVAGILLGTVAIAARHATDPLRDGVAVGLAAVSLGLFVWAVRTVRRTPLTYVFSGDRPTFLITGGPFRLLRNPFYTSYLLAYAYAVVASGNPWLLGVLGWMAAVYVAAALKEERKFQAGPLRDEYLLYRRRT